MKGQSRDHKHPICHVCHIEIEVGDSVLECSDQCGFIMHRSCEK